MSNDSSYRACAYHRASDIPKVVWQALLQNEAAANVILPFATKALSVPQGDDSDQLWIASYDDADNVAFVLSCTKGQLGNYPIFIVASESAAQLAEEEGRGKNIAEALSPLVLCLLDEVPSQRVFSVFAIARVAETFAEIFEAHTREPHGIRAREELYYDATFTFCTHETFNESPAGLEFPLQPSEDIDIALCRADMSYLRGVTTACKAFSETSIHYVLDDASAKMEAEKMITNQEAWVHLVKRASQEAEIACLIATTRESDNVTAVTKVYTAEDWRGRGCAGRLLHRICGEVLRTKKQVVLFVGNTANLAPARKVYHKIGFQGLNGPPGQQVQDVERWIEIGFENTTLGHW